jgi:hypothetical protein
MTLIVLMPRCVVETWADLMMTEAADGCRLQDQLGRRNGCSKEKIYDWLARVERRRTHLRMILTGRTRSLVHWCDGHWNKIRMQGPRAKISGSKIGNSGSRGRKQGLTTAGRAQQSRRPRERRTCPRVAR